MKNDSTETYKSFAGVYDLLTRDADYNRWFNYLIRIWKRYKQRPALVLDLGCGTGNISLLLAENGCDVIGIDSSAEMLAVAAGKALKKKRNILFLNQQMQSFELYGTVDCIISFFDCINYITDKDELRSVFRLASNYLNNSGLFIFDVNTAFKYRRVLASNTFAECNEKCSYIWENFFDKKTGINEYVLSLFIKKSGVCYEKSVEYHYQRAYSQKMLCSLLERAGFTVLGAFDAFSFNKPNRRSERIFFVCRNGNFK